MLDDHAFIYIESIVFKKSLANFGEMFFDEQLLFDNIFGTALSIGRTRDRTGPVTEDTFVRTTSLTKNCHKRVAGVGIEIVGRLEITMVNIRYKNSAIQFLGRNVDFFYILRRIQLWTKQRQRIIVVTRNPNQLGKFFRNIIFRSDCMNPTNSSHLNSESALGESKVRVRRWSCNIADNEIWPKGLNTCQRLLAIHARRLFERACTISKPDGIINSSGTSYRGRPRRVRKSRQKRWNNK